MCISNNVKKMFYMICLSFAIISIFLPNSESNASTEASEYNYDNSGRLIYTDTNNGLAIINRYDNAGNLIVKKVVKIPSVEAPAEVSLSNASYDVYAYGVAKGATSVSFPTWTEANGNDDLENPWVQGRKVSEGVWKATVPFSKHNYETGLYDNDVWVDGKFFGGAKTMVKETTSLRAPEKVGFKAGFYEVVLEGVSDQVQRVTFPTWMEANGQDDIKHVEGQKQANGTWKATIPFSEHNYETGTYTTHAYCYDQYGNSIGIWGASIQVVPGVEAPAEVSLSNASYDVYAYGVAKGAASVSFPTWTEANGNDDLENPWVQGQKVSEGVWKATVPFSKHNYETGLYDNDVWVDGKFFGGAKTMVKETTSLRAPEKVGFKAGFYEVVLEGVSDQVQRVTFPTWTEANGQDDIKHVEGQKQANGTWKATIPFSEHNYETGMYTTHAYCYDQYGNSIGIWGANIQVVPGVEAPAEVSLSNASYDVYAYGVAKGATSVSFPTWTEANGNDDLENPWVQGQKVSEGIWKVTVPFSKHNYETGLYDNDVWVDGKFFGGAKTMVKETTSLRAPEKVGFKAGFYEVVLEGVSDQVQRVTFPTWTEANGQDDIKHVEGQKQANGTWKAIIPFSEHNYETGMYTTHAYCYDQYGNSIGIWGASIQVVPGVEAPAEVSLSNASYDVYAYGVAKGAASVSFPTWTEANGNDDLENPWVQGQKVSEGVWKATVPFSKHNYETGLYDNDVWVDGKFFGGAKTMVKETTSLRAPEKVGFKAGFYEVVLEGVSDQVQRVTFPTWTEANGQDDIKHVEGQRQANGTWKAIIPFSEHNYETGIYSTHAYCYDQYGNSIGIWGANIQVLP